MSDDFGVELVLPVIEGSTLQNGYPDCQYLVLGNSNQEYASPSILQYLPDSGELPPNNIKVESCQNSNGDHDLKLFESIENENYRESIDVTSQTNKVNDFHEVTLSSNNQEIKCNKIEYLSPSTSCNNFNSVETTKNSTSKSTVPSWKPHSAMSVNSSFSNNGNFNHSDSINDQLVEDLCEFNFNDQPLTFETKFVPNFTKTNPVLQANIKPNIKKLSLTNENSKKFCPQCKLKFKENRELRYFQVSLDSSILLCSTEQCTFPFDTPNETLKIKTFSVEDDLISKIDFDIKNIPLNMKHIYKQLSKQENEIIKPFLHNFEELKRNYQQMLNGDLKNPDDVIEENETLMNFINEALPSNQDHNDRVQYLDPKEEAKFNPKEEIEDIDSFIEEQNRELQHMEMLQHFL
uniref:Uncharacterized protein n=1 Tax=Cacopsylla melanoneura TaxID=428564 RepID=A0A8D8QQR4_9HEMI